MNSPPAPTALSSLPKGGREDCAHPAGRLCGGGCHGPAHYRTAPAPGNTRRGRLKG